MYECVNRVISSVRWRYQYRKKREGTEEGKGLGGGGKDKSWVGGRAGRVGREKEGD